MTKKMTADEWLEKAEAEGGSIAALEYGLTHKHLDKDDNPGFYELVKEATELWRQLVPLIEDLDAAIDEVD